MVWIMRIFDYSTIQSIFMIKEMKMDIEDFKKYLFQMQNLPKQIELSIKPYLSIDKIDKMWYCYGFCLISSSFFEPVFIGGYKGKSEIEMEVQSEKNRFVDILHLQLEETFLQKNNIKFNFIPVTEYTYKWLN